MYALTTMYAIHCVLYYGYVKICDFTRSFCSKMHQLSWWYLCGNQQKNRVVTNHMVFVKTSLNALKTRNFTTIHKISHFLAKINHLT